MNLADGVFSWTSQWLEKQGIPHESLSVCDSTNDLAKANSFSDSSVSVYLADQQAHGRGRGTNSWTSPPTGTSLLVTWSFELIFPPQQLTAPLIGLHLYRSVVSAWPSLDWSLKAPNDLYLNDKKVAGLLVESVSRGQAHRLIVGLGFNVLAAPLHVENSTFLQSQLTAKIEISMWQGFFQQLFENIRSASEQVGLTQLPDPLREELLQALKKHPLAKNLNEVSPNSDLIYADRTVGWHEI